MCGSGGGNGASGCGSGVGGGCQVVVVGVGEGGDRMVIGTVSAYRHLCVVQYVVQL